MTPVALNLPLLAYLGIKAMSPSEAESYAKRIEAAWKVFSTLDLEPFKKSVDNGEVIRSSLFEEEQEPIEIGDVLGTPAQMTKLKPYVQLRNQLILSHAEFKGYVANKMSKDSPEVAVGILSMHEANLARDRDNLGKVRKLVSPDPGNLKNPGIVTGTEVALYAGGAVGVGLLVYGVYRLIKRSTESTMEPWQ